MNREPVPTFDSLEDAYEYVSRLREALDEAYGTIVEATAEAQQVEGAARRVDALQIVDFKLNQLRQHMLASLILLNDLRTLRRLLQGERENTEDTSGEGEDTPADGVERVRTPNARHD
jgi:hypothetical protein